MLSDENRIKRFCTWFASITLILLVAYTMIGLYVKSRIPTEDELKSNLKEQVNTYYSQVDNLNAYAQHQLLRYVKHHCQADSAECSYKINGYYELLNEYNHKENDLAMQILFTAEYKVHSYSASLTFPGKKEPIITGSIFGFKLNKGASGLAYLEAQAMQILTVEEEVKELKK